MKMSILYRRVVLYHNFEKNLMNIFYNFDKIVVKDFDRQENYNQSYLND